MVIPLSYIFFSDTSLKTCVHAFAAVSMAPPNDLKCTPCIQVKISRPLLQCRHSRVAGTFIWSAGAGEDSDLAGWQFRGKRIAAAVMQDLLLQHDLAEATHVLLTGDSAGGVGAMNNADWIGSMLRYVICP